MEDCLSSRINDTLFYFQAEKSSTSHKMSHLFENEKRQAKKEHIYQSEDEEAEKTQQTWNIKKRSMFPKGDSANTSKITYCRICMNTKICVCFRV